MSKRNDSNRASVEAAKAAGIPKEQTWATVEKAMRDHAREHKWRRSQLAMGLSHWRRLVDDVYK